jgi:hypothetical protein
MFSSHAVARRLDEALGERERLLARSDVISARLAIKLVADAVKLVERLEKFGPTGHEFHRRGLQNSRQTRQAGPDGA